VTNATAGCDWLVREGVMREERGESIEAHLASCPACHAIHREIEDVRTSLRSIAAPAETEDWQRLVLERVERQHRRQWAIGGAVLAAGALAVTLLWATKSTAPIDGEARAPIILAVRSERDPARPQTRGDLAVGDALTIAVDRLGTDAAELRIYRDDVLAFHCHDGGPCRRDGDRLQARFVIPSLGRYQVVVIAAPAQVPAAAGNFDADLAAGVRGKNARIEAATPIDVW
jgi:hypothetical protein